MEDVRILIGLLDDVNVDTSASRPRRIELNASIWSLTSQFGSPSQSTVDLRNELASHPELASELAKGLFQLASESVPHTPDTGTSSTRSSMRRKNRSNHPHLRCVWLAMSRPATQSYSTSSGNMWNRLTLCSLSLPHLSRFTTRSTVL